MYSMYNCEAYSLRNSIHNNILNVPLPRLEIYKRAPSYKAPTDWNSLPNNIRNANTLTLLALLATIVDLWQTAIVDSGRHNLM